ncbi:MAG: response regulator [Anaerolineae bacterium]|nr:response regulator [Anaerolineae bacterium]
MSETGQLILIIDDDVQIRRFLRASLTNDGYQVIEAAAGQAGISAVSYQHPDLIILDMGLPDLDGLEVTRRLREWTNTPIIILSVRDKEKEKVEALDAGANDYLTKPFGMLELLARMRVALKTSAAQQGMSDPVFAIGDLKVDLSHRLVLVKDQEVHLTPLEYKLLAVLIKYAGKVVTRDHLLREIWGPSFIDESHYLTVYMGQLRRKIEADPTLPRYLITEPGVGYRLKSE